MLLLLDNYDSFTWNLVHALGALAPGLEIQVHRNDAIDAADIQAMSPSLIVISPGPCTPAKTGICRQVIRDWGGRVPLLGVCLGHQAIADVHGVTVRRHDMPVHGRTSIIHHDGKGIFSGLEQGLEVARYHSLVVERKEVVPPLEVSAWTGDGIVMGLRRTDVEAPLVGLQFHPESFLTPCGGRLLANFLRFAEVEVDEAAAVPCVVPEPHQDAH